MRYIDERNDLEGKTVLVRTGLNVSIENGMVVNDFRIRKAIPTILFLTEQGAKVIVISHIGRDECDTLYPVASELNKHVRTIFFSREDFDKTKMKNGDVVLLENLRQDYRERHNHDSLAQELADMADIFVQDAFSVCHREHASIVGIPKFIESYAGLLVKDEVATLSKALDPEHLALFILGGAKLATKKPLVQKFLSIYDYLFIGGTLQNEILAAKGFDVGKSVVEDGAVELNILESDKIQEVKDVLIESSDGVVDTVSINNVKNDDKIVDMGPETVEVVAKKLMDYKTILWNGPLGWYERGFDAATVTLARAISKSDAKTIVGGGDTVAVIQKEGLENDFDFVSTGGGAMLQFLQDGTLPGLEALSK